MAVQFSHVRVSTPDGNQTEFLVCGIPREFDDFEYPVPVLLNIASFAK